MTTDPFTAVMHALAGEHLDATERRTIGAPHGRLLDVLAAGGRANAGPRDLAVLVRQVLRYESAHQGVTQQVRVPRQGWPDEQIWHESSCVVEHATVDELIVSARPWQPGWAPDDAAVGVGAEAALRRRPDLSVAADPFLVDALGSNFDRYSSDGQRQAIRTVLAATPGSTVLVNLPTGSGKSAVVLAPALLQSRPTGLSVVVVPTTSLALDQERAALQHLADTHQASSNRLAYFADLPDGDRQAMKSGIRSGTQRLVFTSPESLVQSLAPSLYDAVRSGHLRYLAVDEAHTVASWGVDFRPEFQALSGFRRDLLREASLAGHPPFTTLLLSATITEEAVDTLVTLFGDPGPLEVIHSVFVRPEPEYWMTSVGSDDQRLEQVIEALRHVPRPAIVYVTQPSQAEDLARALRTDGHSRLAVVAGRTKAQERQQAIRDWRGDTSHNESPRVDVIIGTSAFGLGVDQSDVRTVIHACLPETIDRYYQEVGRGGRDGQAALALLMQTPFDRVIAQRLSATQVIGVELGLQRWKAMVQKGERLPGGRVQVSLDARRGDIVRGSAENEAWNLRTISLMMRAGMLRLDSQRPPELPEEADEAAAKAAFEAYYTSAVVEIVDPRHLDDDRWAEVVEPARRMTIAAARSDYERMLEATKAERDIAELLAAAYAISKSTPLGPDGSTSVQRSCGGCDDCRRHGRQPYAHHPSSPEGVRHPRSTVSEVLQPMVDPTGPPLLVTYDRLAARRKRWREFGEIIEALVKHGIRMVSAPPDVQQQPALQTAHRHVRDGYLFLEPDPMTLFAPRVATLIVADLGAPRAPLPHRYFATPSRPHPRVLLVPNDARDPERPDRDAVELRHPNVELETLLSIL